MASIKEPVADNFSQELQCIGLLQAELSAQIECARVGCSRGSLAVGTDKQHDTDDSIVAVSTTTVDSSLSLVSSSSTAGPWGFTAQAEHLRSALERAMRGGGSETVLLSGFPGSGKVATVDHVLKGILRRQKERGGRQKKKKTRGRFHRQQQHPEQQHPEHEEDWGEEEGDEWVNVKVVRLHGLLHQSATGGPESAAVTLRHLANQLEGTSSSSGLSAFALDQDSDADRPGETTSFTSAGANNSAPSITAAAAAAYAGGAGSGGGSGGGGNGRGGNGRAGVAGEFGASVAFVKTALRNLVVVNNKNHENNENREKKDKSGPRRPDSSSSSYSSSSSSSDTGDSDSDSDDDGDDRPHEKADEQAEDGIHVTKNRQSSLSSFSPSPARCCVVLVLERFEEFAAEGRQTLLYTLLDLRHEKGIHLVVVAVTSHQAVLELLEKRVRSRFGTVKMIHFTHPTQESALSLLRASLTLDQDPEPSSVRSGGAEGGGGGDVATAAAAASTSAASATADREEEAAAGRAAAGEVALAAQVERSSFPAAAALPATATTVPAAAMSAMAAMTAMKKASSHSKRRRWETETNGAERVERSPATTTTKSMDSVAVGAGVADGAGATDCSDGTDVDEDGEHDEDDDDGVGDGGVNEGKKRRKEEGGGCAHEEEERSESPVGKLQTQQQTRQQYQQQQQQPLLRRVRQLRYEWASYWRQLQASPDWLASVQQAVNLGRSPSALLSAAAVVVDSIALSTTTTNTATNANGDDDDDSAAADVANTALVAAAAAAAVNGTTATKTMTTTTTSRTKVSATAVVAAAVFPDTNVWFDALVGARSPSLPGTRAVLSSLSSPELSLILSLFRFERRLKAALLSAPTSTSTSSFTSSAEIGGQRQGPNMGVEMKRLRLMARGFGFESLCVELRTFWEAGGAMDVQRHGQRSLEHAFRCLLHRGLVVPTSLPSSSSSSSELLLLPECFPSLDLVGPVRLALALSVQEVEDSLSTQHHPPSSALSSSSASSTTSAHSSSSSSLPATTAVLQKRKRALRSLPPLQLSEGIRRWALRTAETA